MPSFETTSLQLFTKQMVVCFLWSPNDTELIHPAEMGITPSPILPQPYCLLLTVILQHLSKRISADARAERRALCDRRKWEMGQEKPSKKLRRKLLHPFRSLSSFHFVYWHTENFENLNLTLKHFLKPSMTVLYFLSKFKTLRMVYDCFMLALPCFFLPAPG